MEPDSDVGSESGPPRLGVPINAAGAVPPAPPAGRAGPLSEEDYLAVRRAAGESSGVRRTVATAKASGVTTLVIGAVALISAYPFNEWVGTVTAAGVCVVGAVELVGCGRLRRGERGAARMLWVNQVSFLALIVGYCVLQMVTFTPAKARATAVSPEFRAQLAVMPEMQRDVDRMVDRLAPVVMYGLYGGTIALSVLIQGGLAWRYRKCERRVGAMEGTTPAWVYRVLKEARGE